MNGKNIHGDRARQHFFFAPAEAKLFAPVAHQLDSADEPFVGFGRAFQRNLTGTVATLTVPFHLTVASLQRRQFQALYTAERIRAGVHAENEGDTAAEEVAMTKTRSRMKEEWESKEHAGRAGAQVLEELGADLENEVMAVGSVELLRQGVVLTWGSLEVFVRDFFVAAVNARPELGRVLVESEKTRHLFQLKSVPFAVLAEYGFSVQSRLGQLLAAQYDLDSVPAMKSVFGALFPSDASLRAALDDRRLWLLAQRRNLIVHRRAIVDAQYLAATGDTVSEGSELRVTPAEAEAYMQVSVEVVAQLLRAWK